MKIIIKNASVFVTEQQQSLIVKKNIMIQDDLITGIASEFSDESEFQMDRVIDGTNHLVLPGLVNCHTHLGMTLFRGYANDMPLWDWLSKRIWPLEDQLVAEDVYWASQLSIMEMVKSGTTTFSDMYFFMDATARAVEISGIRAMLSRGLQGPDDKSELRIQENRALYHNWNHAAKDRIRVVVGPHAEYTCSPEYLLECVKLSEELDTGIHIHVSETLREHQECKLRHGKTPVRFLRDLGVLTRPVTAAHCVAIEEEDINILAACGTSVVYNPGSNCKLGSGFAPIPAMMGAGINIGLGTDSAASNNNLNLWEEIYLAAILSKAVTGDSTMISTLEAFQMATINSAKALQWEDQIGTLQVGKKADLFMVNLDQPYYQPKTDLLTHFVYSGQSADVSLTMVNGEILMENGRYFTIDQERVFYEIEKIRSKLF